MWSRIHLIPVLQAEEDRDLVRRTLAAKAMEKELLGAETDVYHSDRSVTIRFGDGLQASLQSLMFCFPSFVRPTYAVTPSHVTK